MVDQLKALVKAEQITKFRSFDVSMQQNKNEYQINAQVQIRGHCSFCDLIVASLSLGNVECIFNKLIQIHIWNAPDDMPILIGWQDKFSGWLDRPTEYLCMSDESIKMTQFSIVTLKSMKDS